MQVAGVRGGRRQWGTSPTSYLGLQVFNGPGHVCDLHGPTKHFGDVTGLSRLKDGFHGLHAHPEWCTAIRPVLCRQRVLVILDYVTYPRVNLLVHCPAFHHFLVPCVDQLLDRLLDRSQLIQLLTQPLRPIGV